MKRHKEIIFSLLILCFGSWLSAQEKIQVLTKTVTKSFEITEGHTLNINGEKANIMLNPSKDNKIYLKLMLVSKNPSVQNAENDLKYCNYHINEKSNSINISNNFNSKDIYTKISSNLSARYEIQIPKNLSISIRNIYGNITLSEINSNLKINSDFCQIELNDIGGSLTINSNYSDIKASGLHSSSSIMARKADILIDNVTKPLTITDHYGKIFLKEIKAPVTIDANLTEIEIEYVDLKNYSFDLYTVNSEIIASQDIKKAVVTIKESSYFKTTGIYPVKIKTIFNSITLKNR